MWTATSNDVGDLAGRRGAQSPQPQRCQDCSCGSRGNRPTRKSSRMFCLYTVAQGSCICAGRAVYRWGGALGQVERGIGVVGVVRHLTGRGPR